MKKSSRDCQMSIVVPMYNSKAFLERSIASLDAQTAEQSEFQVILVDDGSTDETLALARQLAAQRPNYTVLTQQNKGVSAARNAGIRAARGRYIMFLDADDTLSAPSVEALVLAFGKFGDAVDLVTYPITFYDVQTGGTHSHLRYRWLTHTGVYDLQEFPFVAQTTINVCIKNDGSNTPMFIEGRRYCEDQAFNTPILSKKRALGFCAEANYGYYREPASATMSQGLVEWGFDDLVSNLDEITRLAEADERFCDYAYSLVLNNLGWRLTEHKLLPDFGDAATREANYERLGSVLQRVPVAAWETNPYLSDVQRLWLMQRFGVVGDAERCEYTSEGMRLFFDDGRQLMLGMPSMRLHWAVRTQNALKLKGCVYGPLFAQGARGRGEGGDARGGVTLFFRYGDASKSVSAELLQSPFEDRGVRIDEAWYFEVDLPNMQKLYHVSVDAMVDGLFVPGFRPWFDLCRTNSRYINLSTREFGDRRLVITGNQLKIGTVKDLPTWTMPVVGLLMNQREKTRTGDFDAREVSLLRSEVPKALKALHGERVWLYVGASRAFAHDLHRHDSVVRLSLDELDGLVARVAAFLGAEKIVSSKLEFEELLPCDRRTWNRIADLTRLQTYAFLGDAAEDLAGTPYDEAVG